MVDKETKILMLERENQELKKILRAYDRTYNEEPLIFNDLLWLIIGGAGGFFIAFILFKFTWGLL